MDEIDYSELEKGASYINTGSAMVNAKLAGVLVSHTTPALPGMPL
jgi:hypothetical protein